MSDFSITALVTNLLLVLVAGLAAGIICKRLSFSVLVGYLVVGAVMGEGGLGWVAGTQHELKYLAETGALFLLFAIGIEFSLEELVRLRRHFFVGGSLQMALVIGPVVALGSSLGMTWRAALLVGAAAALSSTVLVFKALEEYGHVATPHGRRSLGILLFQDVALVPLMLLVPALSGEAAAPSAADWLLLARNSTIFVGAAVAARIAIAGWIVPLLAALRSRELVVLFALTVLGGFALGAFALRLPPALGAFAAGLVLSENRLTGQIDALVLPYRETFAAVFFVSLGTLMQLRILIDEPLLCAAALAVLLALKTGAAAVALRVIGVRWRVALGMGLGLAQMGEFSFLLLSAAQRQAVISAEMYHRLIFLAMGTLVVTPQLLKTGLIWAGTPRNAEPAGPPGGARPQPIRQAVVIGAGPIGSRAASQLELTGVDVCLIDLSPVNLHRFAQEGFHTVAGDATDREVLEHAGVTHCSLVLVTVPRDDVARQVVVAIRKLNRQCRILVRCRYQSNAAAVRKAGADAVVSEEAEAAAGLLRLLEQTRKDEG